MNATITSTHGAAATARAHEFRNLEISFAFVSPE
jgi:hypothetical protein